ncbi:MAG: LytTR family DNA-binding domain-containing protein, partial [Blastocatellia bacterium]|nr:LytTR family DNA-binding domain-containing protein [Blastocatellia bacterium]
MPERRRILIVDDEPLARQRIERFVRAYDPAFAIEEAENGLVAIDRIARFRPEIVFLDVEMPGLNGFEALQQLETRDFQIIFQTAFDQFAIRAFEEAACDYLLKPFTAERLHQALARALERAASEERLRTLEACLRRQPENRYLRRLTVKQGTRLRIVESHDIYCFISRDHTTCLYFSDGNLQREGICELSLGKLIERLDPTEFRQLHRNNIARIPAIRALTRSPNREIFVELINGMKLPVSRG